MIEDKKISGFRMFLHILDASLMATFLMSGIQLGIISILIWPLAILFLITSFTLTLAALPVLLFLGLPISLFLYRRRQDSPYTWIFSYFFMLVGYFLLIILAQNQPLQTLAIVIIFAPLVGLSLWMKLYKHRYETP